LRSWHFAAAASIAIAAGTWWMLAPHSGLLERIVPEAPLMEPDFSASDDRTIEPPTLLCYRKALAQSPVELDELLDRQATTTTALPDQVTPAMLTRWNDGLHSPLGEM
jgi:hypothetical protein